jgi:hypothetical protein
LTEQQPYRVTWGLEAFPDDVVPDFMKRPGMDMFQLSFASADEARQFIAELHRYLGHLYIRQLESKEGLTKALKGSL